MRTSIAPVTPSISVVMNGADAPREEPSTHSAYAVTESRRGTPERLRRVRREILIGSASGTYCEQFELDAVGLMLEAAVAEAVAGDVGPVVADRLRRRGPEIAA